MQTITEQGAARIGRSGGKLHPAIRENGHVYFRCSCPSTQNGSASNHCTFFPGATRTCRARVTPVMGAA